MLFGGGDLKRRAGRMHMEPMRGSCRTQWHQQRNGARVKLEPEARTACTFTRELSKITGCGSCKPLC